MYLHNTTFKIALLHNNDFLEHLQVDVIPQLNSELEVIDTHLLELLNVDTQDGNTYCLHITFKSLEAYNNYKIYHENKILNELVRRYKDEVLFFSSVLKKVN